MTTCHGREERKGKPLIVPRTGTQPRVSKTSWMSNGGVKDARSVPFLLSSLTLNFSVFSGVGSSGGRPMLGSGERKWQFSANEIEPRGPVGRAGR